MSRILVSGAGGFVGRFIVAHLLAAGHDVIAGRRTLSSSPFRTEAGSAIATVALPLDPALDATAAFDGIDIFIHAAFQHVPGRYRGGEGDDPQGFRRANLDGSLHLFRSAKTAGVRRCLFLSSRAVYGLQLPGIVLTEDMTLNPETLYGQVKMEAEAALATMDGSGFATTSLRATGIYGPLTARTPQKWASLVSDYLAGKAVKDRIGTEVHATDLADAVLRLIGSDRREIRRKAFNVSDILTSHRDILAIVKSQTACPHPLPDALDATGFNAMSTKALRDLGWRPGGRQRLVETVSDLVDTIRSSGPCCF